MKKTCFYIGPYGDEGSLIHIWTENVLVYLVTPVISKLNYKNPLRLDNISTKGMLSVDVLRHLVDDNLVIADLTETDPNVFYLLAIRHILQKPVIHIIRKGDQVPFDFANINILTVRTDDLNLVENARQELRRQIVDAEKNKVSNISYVKQINQLRGVFSQESTVTEKELLLSLFQQIEEVRVNVDEVKRELFDLNNQLGNVNRKSIRASTFIDKRLAKAELVKRKSRRQ